MQITAELAAKGSNGRYGIYGAKVSGPSGSDHGDGDQSCRFELPEFACQRLGIHAPIGITTDTHHRLVSQP